MNATIQAKADTRLAPVFRVDVHDWGVRVGVVRVCGGTGECCRILAKSEAVKRADKGAKLACCRCGIDATTVRSVQDFVLDHMGHMGYLDGTR